MVDPLDDVELEEKPETHTLTPGEPRAVQQHRLALHGLLT
jgi:hypothetical protein